MNINELLSKLQALNPLPLGHLPTPLEPLPRLSQALNGPELWIKRDDQTGLATGGNKVRKLAYLMSAALEQGADWIVTAGAQQSNHARQTAAAAAHLGLPCTLVLQGTAPAVAAQGNYLLDRILGANISWAKTQPLPEALAEEATRLKQRNYHPYIIPYGGSNAIGVCGYVHAMAELLQQMRAQSLSLDAIVVASSSGGTQAGMILGAQALGYTGRIVGISIAESRDTLQPLIAGLANDTAEMLNIATRVSENDVLVKDIYLGQGYGKISALERQAIALAGTTEGLLVDPVYTGRALGGLTDMIKQKEFSPEERVLFWHTGGIPALFACAQEILVEPSEKVIE